MVDRPLPRIEGERPPPGFSFLPTDVFEFRCRNAGCGKTQKQDSPVREFHVGKVGLYKKPGATAAPVDWWWCDTCRARLRQSKRTTSNSAKKLEHAARNTRKIQFTRTEPPGV